MQLPSLPPVAQAAVIYKAVVTWLLIHCNRNLPLCMVVLFLVFVFLYSALLSVLSRFTIILTKKRAGFFAFISILVSCPVSVMWLALQCVIVCECL